MTNANADLKPAFRDIAQRMQNAYDGLVENLVELGGISQEEADLAARAFIKAKACKLALGIGRYEFKHGAFLEPAVIQNAVEVGRTLRPFGFNAR